MTNSNQRPIDWQNYKKPSKAARDIMRNVGRAGIDYNLLEPNDRILVACSGGKDSTTLLWALGQSRARIPFPIELVPLNIDQGFGHFEQEALGRFLTSQGFTPQLIQEHAATIIEEKLGKRHFGESANKSACWLCSRLRRGALYSQAKRLGCNKIALGHHADDAIETMLMNLVFNGRIKAMPPKLRTDDGALVVIRPLAYLFEETIIRFKTEMRFPTFGCACPHEEGLLTGERLAAKQWLKDLKKRFPFAKENALASLGRVKPSHLYDKMLYDFNRFKRIAKDEED